jgi:hypothetical protein
MGRKPKVDDPQQAAAFRKAARELGADDNEERFREVLRTVAKHRPQDSKTDKNKS